MNNLEKTNSLQQMLGFLSALTKNDNDKADFESADRSATATPTPITPTGATIESKAAPTTVTKAAPTTISVPTTTSVPTTPAAPKTTDATKTRAVATSTTKSAAATTTETIKREEQSNKRKQLNGDNSSGNGTKKSAQDSIVENKMEKVKKESPLNNDNLVKKEQKFSNDPFTIPGFDKTVQKRIYLKVVFVGIVLMVLFVNRYMSSPSSSPVISNDNDDEITSTGSQLVVATTSQPSHSVKEYLTLIFHPFVPKTKTATMVQPQLSAVDTETNFFSSNNGMIIHEKQKRRIVVNPVKVLVKACQNIFKSITNLFKIEKIDDNKQLEDDDDLSFLK